MYNSDEKTQRERQRERKILNPIYAVKFMEKDYYQVFNSILKTIILFGTNNRTRKTIFGRKQRTFLQNINLIIFSWFFLCFLGIQFQNKLLY